MDLRLNTATKLAIARKILSLLLFVGVRPQQTVTRQGIRYTVDLREGIDLSVFLFGRFQSSIVDYVERHIPPDGVVVDVGANIGAMTLPFAAAVPRGRVIAIEPTDYAFAKLLNNIRQNPTLAGRITLLRTFVADKIQTVSTLKAYSSWPLDHQDDESHTIHGGKPMKASCGQTTIDDIAERFGVTVSLIKIDTDGEEYSVIRGASRSMVTSRPDIIFEACPYLMTSPGRTFQDFQTLFEEYNYAICDLQERPITASEFARRTPPSGSVDLLGLPRERLSRG